MVLVEIWRKYRKTYLGVVSVSKGINVLKPRRRGVRRAGGGCQGSRGQPRGGVPCSGKRRRGQGCCDHAVGRPRLGAAAADEQPPIVEGGPRALLLFRGRRHGGRLTLRLICCITRFVGLHGRRGRRCRGQAELELEHPQSGLGLLQLVEKLALGLLEPGGVGARIAKTIRVSQLRGRRPRDGIRIHHGLKKRNPI